MKKAVNNPRPANEYDKIFKENMQQALPGVIKRLLGLHLSHSEDLPTDLQQTKERKPDVLQRVTDTSGHSFVLHIEWQVKNDEEMAYRMAEQPSSGRCRRRQAATCGQESTSISCGCWHSCVTCLSK